MASGFYAKCCTDTCRSASWRDQRWGSVFPGFWLRGPMREWAEALLDEAVARGRIFRWARCGKWDDHLLGAEPGSITCGTYSCFRHGWNSRKRSPKCKAEVVRVGM